MLGTWTNSGWQRWEIFEDRNAGLLKAETEEYVIGTRDRCPLEHLAIEGGYYDLGRQDAFDEIPGMYKTHPYTGDSSSSISVDKEP